jgi:hypothetical protein
MSKATNLSATLSCDDDRQRHAPLAGTAEGRVDDTASAPFERGIFQHQAVILGFTERLHSLAMGSGRRIDMFAHRRRPDEADAAYGRMRQEALGFIAAARDEIQDAVRQAGFLPQFGASHRSHRGHRGRLDHQSIAAGEAQGRHPAHRDHARKIERGDSGEHANRLTVQDRVIPGGRIHERLAQHEVGDSTSKFDRFLHLEDIATRFLPHLAVLGGHEAGQLVEMRVQEIPEPIQHLSALHDGRLRPCRKGVFRRLDGSLHLPLSATRRLCDDLTPTGIVHVHVLVGCRIVPFSAN